jgi:hypothetical protein
MDDMTREDIEQAAYERGFRQGVELQKARTKRRSKVNWGWIRRRIRRAFRCRHVWVDGDTASNKACRKCGVWRWFPRLP